MADSQSAGKRSFLATVALRVGQYLVEFFLILQVWIVANLHRAHEVINDPIELAKAGYGAANWADQGLGYLDRALDFLKMVDDRTYYAFLSYIFHHLEIPWSHATGDKVLIVVGTLYVFWSLATRIYGTLLNWGAKRTLAKKLRTEFENDTSIATGALVGFALGFIPGAVIGAIMGAIGKANSHAEVQDAERQALSAKLAIPSALLGAVLTLLLDLALQFGPELLPKLLGVLHRFV